MFARLSVPLSVPLSLCLYLSLSLCLSQSLRLNAFHLAPCCDARLRLNAGSDRTARVATPTTRAPCWRDGFAELIVGSRSSRAEPCFSVISRHGWLVTETLNVRRSFPATINVVNSPASCTRLGWTAVRHCYLSRTVLHEVPDQDKFGIFWTDGNLFIFFWVPKWHCFIFGHF